MPERFFDPPNPDFPRLFEPGFIGSMRIKNRIVMAPMGTQLASNSGAVTEAMIRHYARRALGGVGLIIVEFTCVDYPRGKGHACQLALHDDNLISSHGHLVDAVHREGAKISIQLHHAGGNTVTSRTEGLELVAPGAIPGRALQDQPRILRTEEIPDLVEKFALAVRRAKYAGYDSVELHGAHGYLIAEFMSPYVNNRTDMWGGNLANRMRFPLAVISRAKELVGSDFPITMRISGVELVPGGRTIEDTAEIAQILEKAGLAALHISAGIDTDFDWAVDPIFAPQGRKVDLAAAVKRTVAIPVIAVGVIREPAFAERVLADGKADFVAIGRGLLADPDWAAKAAEGRSQDIRRCISCNNCEGLRSRSGLSVRCVTNPEVGTPESEWVAAAAAKKKRVMVVGGGPAGIEVSRMAASRGHEVLLYEQQDRLGGQLLLAAKSPGKDKISWLLEDLVKGLSSTSAKVTLRTRVTPELISEVGPDIVVLATGALPSIPHIEGIDSGRVITSWSAIEGAIPAGAKRFVVIGGNSTGCETAVLLASKSDDVRVVLIEQMLELAGDMDPSARQATLRHLAEAKNIQTYLGWKVIEITDEVVVVRAALGETRSIESDCVVLAAGAAPDDELLTSLGEQHVGVYAVGDGSRVGNIASALADARLVGAWI
jgi:2,4-dienoyl-CoA reductase-like NADH-dependent reductase (Old Yellow Enzyme family)/thioredoxin reductase